MAGEPGTTGLSGKSGVSDTPSTPEDTVRQHPVDESSLPKDYFAHPMKLPVSLSASFAEIRPNHFHGGIDLRVGGKVGEPVYAAAEGYVSRIKVSPWGGGKHVYITHPNGFRTVYMHLDHYAGELAQLVESYQYSHRVFAFDIDLPADSISVEKGQLIGYAGNTGSSGGPHLHYEIRFADNDQPINPFYFGLDFTDPVPPTIVNVKLYPAGPATMIDGAAQEWFQTSRRKVGKQYLTTTADSVSVAGRFYAGIYTYDVSEPSKGRNGVERVELYVDGSIHSVYSVPTYIYEETRSINAHIDYAQYLKSKEYYILSRQLPGVRYPKVVAARDSGYICFNDSALHTLEYRVFDYKGNCTKRTLSVRSLPANQTEHTSLPAVGNLEDKAMSVDFRRAFTIDSAGFRAEMKPHTLYADDNMVFRVSSRGAGFFGSRYTVYPSRHNLPPNIPYNIQLPLPKGTRIPASKFLIVALNGKKASAVATRIDGGVLCAEVKTFGTFTVAADTVAPDVKPSNFAPSAAVTAKELRLKVTDNLAGIDTYNCYLDGRWILAEYDPKNNALIIDAKRLKKGVHELKVEVSDAVGNNAQKKWTVTR